MGVVIQRFWKALGKLAVKIPEQSLSIGTEVVGLVAK